MRLDIFLFLCHDAKSAPVSISQRHRQPILHMSYPKIVSDIVNSFPWDWEEEGSKGGSVGERKWRGERICLARSQGSSEQGEQKVEAVAMEHEEPDFFVVVTGP
jgi:hypothetical protein